MVGGRQMYRADGIFKMQGKVLIRPVREGRTRIVRLASFGKCKERGFSDSCFRISERKCRDHKLEYILCGLTT